MMRNMFLKVGDIITINDRGDIGVIESFSDSLTYIFWNDGVTRSIYTDILRTEILRRKIWEHHAI
jgi:hypothetical protein